MKPELTTALLLPDDFLQRLVFSETATNVPALSLQIELKM
jgi:hypothetical protein